MRGECEFPRNADVDVSWEITSKYLLFTAPSSDQVAGRKRGVGRVFRVNDYGEQDMDLWPRNSAFHFAGALQTSRQDSCFKQC